MTSLPFAPEVVLPAIDYYRNHLDLCAATACVVAGLRRAAFRGGSL